MSNKWKEYSISIEAHAFDVMRVVDKTPSRAEKKAGKIVKMLENIGIFDYVSAKAHPNRTRFKEIKDND